MTHINFSNVRQDKLPGAWTEAFAVRRYLDRWISQEECVYSKCCTERHKRSSKVLGTGLVQTDQSHCQPHKIVGKWTGKKLHSLWNVKTTIRLYDSRTIRTKDKLGPKTRIGPKTNSNRKPYFKIYFKTFFWTQFAFLIFSLSGRKWKFPVDIFLFLKRSFKTKLEGGKYHHSSREFCISLF